MKDKLQQVVRSIHNLTLNKGLPRRIALYFHSLERAHWASFEELVAFFQNQGYRFTDPGDYVSAASDSAHVLLTFDDNYRNWYDCLSLFDRLSVQATFYVNTLPLSDSITADELDDYYDRIRHYEDRTPLDQNGVRALADHGHTIGSHTHSHFRLTSLSPEEARREIKRGQEVLGDILGHPIRHFSYPYGMRRHFNRQLFTYCSEIGIETIATGIPAMLHSPSRISIHRSPWRLEKPLQYNLTNLEIDGSFFERLTGRAAAV